jgi:hypothetical protein
MAMPKTKITTADLAWVFYEKLRAFGDCPAGIPIAIVPDPKFGWSAVTNPKDIARRLPCAKRVQAVQKQLREIYILARD